MTPQEAHARAVTELADLLTRAHDDPHDAANRFIGGLVRSGWRPVGALADRPGPAPAQQAGLSDKAKAELAEARAEIARKKRAREAREAAT